MFANSDEFKAFVIEKNVQSVNLLEITIVEHISNICKSAANHLNQLVRSKTFLDSDETRVLVNSFVLCSFDYCPLVWVVSSSASLRKIKNMHKRALVFLLNDYVSSYEQLLYKSSEAYISLRNHRVICTENFNPLVPGVH